MAGHESASSRGLRLVPLVRTTLSLYLWHWPVFLLGAALTASGLLTVKQALLGIAVSILLAWGSYRFVEQPPQRMARLRPTNRALWFGLVLIVTTCVAAVGVGRLADAKVAAQFEYVTQGLAPVQKAHPPALHRRPITNRARCRWRRPARPWDFRTRWVGARSSPTAHGWTPPAWTSQARRPRPSAQPSIPGTVVVALGTNSFNVGEGPREGADRHDSAAHQEDRRRAERDRRSDPAQAFADGVDKIMAMVPPPRPSGSGCTSTTSSGPTCTGGRTTLR
jgi:hypothetical protein